MNSLDVRKQLVEALRLDLVGPDTYLGDAHEALPQTPSRWYLTGFLVPFDAGDSQRAEPVDDDELDELSDRASPDENTSPEPPAARRKHFPSSIGLSLLVDADTRELQVTARWGDYRRQAPAEGGRMNEPWQRTPRQEAILIPLPGHIEQPAEHDVAGSAGLKIVVSVRPVHSDGGEEGLPVGTRSVSVFLVNRRTPAPDDSQDEAFAFQAQLEVACQAHFVPRPNIRSLVSDDWDERVADVQFRDAYEYAVGHGVAAETTLVDGGCRAVRTCWAPQAEVERVAASKIPGVTLSMDALAQLADGQATRAALASFVTAYRAWIAAQRQAMPQSPPRRKETANELLNRADYAAGRIEAGIKLLDDPRCLEAFRITNRAIATTARRRFGVMQQKDPATIVPEWRPFQLAFLLMNLPGIIDPQHEDRRTVDLLFFPTGGGKTEAYLGLAAYTLIWRRLTNPGIASSGVSVLMRYTLRLLTLDQLSRAATLICALELERQQDVEKLGEWPFEIGLWVGKAATPNVMGRQGDGKSETARAKTIAFKNDDRKPAPIPLEECPWCGKKFKASSFQLTPSADQPTDLRVMCVDRHCDFSRGNYLPILGVDEPIYRRLPCFLIATVDKFAAMPWTGEVGGFFGRVQRHDKHGFYGPCDPNVGTPLPAGHLPPPDLVIQDELHLISGPLGTLAGLYETALDELASVVQDGQTIRPKIVASTATVRRAESQILALFNRRNVEVFPPPGPDRRHSFFAETHSTTQSPARLYLGIAAQGRSPRVAMLRTYLALLAAAQKAYARLRKDKIVPNPADPYMTLLGYFNSLRELGGSRRVIEDEIVNTLAGYGNRRRVGETDGLFANRQIAYEPVELTSRVSTDKVADAKRRLAIEFGNKDQVDVAIATNMISVGLDITRLGLMVVYGQPKASAEYIQSTSRVGRDQNKPGLVVTVLNIHKPRDRSHYERFAAWHETFYRSVEATSVTPFSPRALDRGLAGTLVALARQGLGPMTPPKGATEILHQRPQLAYVVDCLAERAASHRKLDPAEAAKLRDRVRVRAEDLLDEWERIALEYQQVGVATQYQEEVGQARRLLYQFLDSELNGLHRRHRKFRANRSLRDVEPNVNLRLRDLAGIDIEEDEE